MDPIDLSGSTSLTTETNEKSSMFEVNWTYVMYGVIIFVVLCIAYYLYYYKYKKGGADTQTENLAADDVDKLIEKINKKQAANINKQD